MPLIHHFLLAVRPIFHTLCSYYLIKLTGIKYTNDRPMYASQEVLSRERVEAHMRDYCAHLLVPWNRCRREEVLPFPWNCQEEAHAYERCQYIEYVLCRVPTRTADACASPSMAYHHHHHRTHCRHCPTTTDVFGRRSVSELVSSRAAVAAVTTAVHHMPCPALLDRAWTLSYVYT